MPDTDTVQEFERLQRLLGEQYDVDRDRGRISESSSGATVADYYANEGRLWSYVTVYVHDIADASDQRIVDRATEAIERRGADMRALGWELLDNSGTVDPVLDEGDVSTVTFEVEHVAPSANVVATLLAGRVAPPFEFEA